jgi:hypothetical protein
MANPSKQKGTAVEARADLATLRHKLWQHIVSGDYTEEDLRAYRSLDTAILAVATIASSGDPRASRKIATRWRIARSKALGRLERRLFS